MIESEARQALVHYGRILFSRGYGCGTSGNLSVKLEGGGYLMSPTNLSLGDLREEDLSRLDERGEHVAGARPTKEAWLHFAMYRSRPADGAIVHLHSTYAVALSCRTDMPADDMLPPITPYAAMRVGRVARVPYGRPGNAALSGTIEQLARDHRALLLSNHGPIVSARDLETAWAAAEELEETARLFFILEGRPHSRLQAEQLDELRQAFGA